MKRLIGFFAALSLVAWTGCATTPEQPAEPPKPATTEAPAAPEQATAPKTAEPPADKEPWRAERPKPGDAPELVTPKFQKTTLKNGLTVYVVERHDLPLVSLAVATSAGTAQDPKGKAGLAELTYRTLLEGAGKRDAIALEQAFNDLGGEPFVLTRPDGAMVGTKVLTRNAGEALQLLADVVQRPQLEKEAFELKQREQLNALAAAAGSPGYLAQWAFANVLYGAEHPYGQVGSGTPESVSALKVNDVKSFWKKNAGPKASALVVTGDVTLDQAKQWAEKYFGKWKGSAGRPPVPPEVNAAAKRQIVLVPKAGLAQTVIAMGRPSIESGHPDEAALELASTVFGGFFGSRLNMNLREDKGYSYGAGAYVDARRGDGPLVASSSVRADVTGASVKEFLNELQGLKERPITEQELKAAKDGLVRSLPGTFDTVEDLSRSAAGLFWEDKELDHYQKLVDRLESATPAQVQAAAEKYFDPSTLSLVMVGDPDQVMLQVEPLQLGKVEVRPPPKPVQPAAAGAKPAGPAAR